MKKNICLIYLFLLSFILVAQDFESLFYQGLMDLELPADLANQVHSLDDFMGRFNGLHTAFGKPIDQSITSFKNVKEDLALWTEFRGKIISSLMVENLLEDTLNTNKFIRIASTSKNLDYYNSNWHVRVPYTGTLNEFLYTGLLFLRVTTIQDKSRWIIDSVTINKVIGLDNVEKVIPEYCSDVFIPPSAHDNGFIALSKVLKTKYSLHNHITRSEAYFDRLAHLMNHGEVTIDTSTLRFCFRIASGASFSTNPHFEIIHYEF